MQLSDLDYERYRKFHSFRQNIASAIKVTKGRKSIDEGEADNDSNHLLFIFKDDLLINKIKKFRS